MDEQTVGPDLVVTAGVEGNVAVLSLKGELDAYTAPTLEERIGALLTEERFEVVLDLSETTFVDSSGLRAILTAQRRLRESGGNMRLRRPSEPVRRLLDITGLTEHFASD